MSKKHKKVYAVWTCIEHQLILIFTVTQCASISAFALAGTHIEITSPAIELKICVITTRIKKFKSIIKKEKKKHDKTVSLPKSKLNSVEFLTSKALIDEFALTHDMLKEFYHIKKENSS